MIFKGVTLNSVCMPPLLLPCILYDKYESNEIWSTDLLIIDKHKSLHIHINIMHNHNTLTLIKECDCIHADLSKTCMHTQTHNHDLPRT